jgi:hypothetical protein
MEKVVRAHSDARWPIAGSSFLAAQMLSPIAVVSGNGSNFPVTPFCTASGNPPTSNAQTGEPQACASMATCPKLSMRDVSTNTSIAE